MLPQKIIGETAVMKQILKTVESIALTDAAVFLRGESGTGKELIAQEIHHLSPRKEMPFIPVNCGAIPENLLESELFGHEKGAFTGAFEQHKGKFETADGGTIFLDEVNSLPLLLQSKLLRVLPTGEITRVGGNQVINVDVRIISATNSSPEKLVSQGKLREDLYYRLNVVPISLPPLRERGEDIPLLLDYYVDFYSKKYDKPIKGFSPDAIVHLKEYNWPGNVRELQNLIERLIALEHREWIHADSLPEEMRTEGGGKIFFTPFGGGDSKKSAPSPNLEAREKDAIQEALKQAAGNRSKAADILGIHRNTLMKKLKEYGLDVD